MRQSPAEPDYAHRLGRALNDLAQDMIDLGEDRAVIRPLVLRAIDLQRGALKARPRADAYLAQLANHYRVLERIDVAEADEQFKAGRVADAEKTRDAIHERAARLVAEFPDVPAFGASSAGAASTSRVSTARPSGPPTSRWRGKMPRPVCPTTRGLAPAWARR